MLKEEVVRNLRELAPGDCRGKKKWYMLRTLFQKRGILEEGRTGEGDGGAAGAGVVMKKIIPHRANFQGRRSRPFTLNFWGRRLAP